MSSQDIEIWFRRRARHSENIEWWHQRFVEESAKISSPLSFPSGSPPPTPECGAELCASFGGRLAAPGLRFQGSYIFRGPNYAYEDKASFDDVFRIGAKTTNRAVPYRDILYKHLLPIAEAFGSYRTFVSVDLYANEYWGGLDNSNREYNKLLENNEIDVDGRNNIYTLYPAQFWDDELCERALGYDSREVVRRLRPHAKLVQETRNGVYVVLDDDPDISLGGFLAMNQRFKTLLGIG